MKISVTVLVYNSAQHLTQALRCLKEQTFKDFEVIMFDDHSTDRSSEICQDFARHDTRFKHVVPKTRLGLQASRSAVLSECSGEYIAVLDSDDLCEPSRLEKQMAAITSDPEIVLVTSLCGRVDEAGKKSTRPETPWLDGAGLTWRLIFGNSIFHSSVLFNRKLAVEVGGYDPTLSTCEDADLYGRLLKRGEAYCVDEILTYWRIHPNNISRGVDDYKLKRQDALSIFQKLIYDYAHVAVDLDTTETLYFHVRAQAKDTSTFISALKVTQRALKSFVNKYSTSIASQRSVVREALLTLADLQKTNKNDARWAELKRAWRRCVSQALAEGRRVGYHWFTDRQLFYPQRQIPVPMMIELLIIDLSGSAFYSRGDKSGPPAPMSGDR